jgi:TolB protein
LKKDDVVYLLGRREDNQWYQIIYPPGSSDRAWIFAEVVKPDSDPSNLPIVERLPTVLENQAIGVSKEYLTVRNGPGTNYDAVGYLSPGREITIIGTTPDSVWFFIQVPSNFPPNAPKTAWVKAEFVEARSSIALLETAPIPPTPSTTRTPIPTVVPGSPPLPVGRGRVLLASNTGGTNDVYAIVENGSGLTRLTTLTQCQGARFSPDGSRIAFYRTISVGQYAVYHLFVMNANGSNQIDLSRTSDSDSDPDWSPDGSKIVFVRTPRVGGPELWVMNSDGSNARKLISLTADTAISFADAAESSPRPRWSPDGTRISFAAVFRPPGTNAALFPSIYVVNVDGSGLIQLTDNDLINTGPVWSPDSKQISWSAKDFINRQNWRVRMMNADGSGGRALINSADGVANHAVQVVDWFAGRLLVAGWHGSWDGYWFGLGGNQLQQFTFGPGDNRPTDWLP